MYDCSMLQFYILLDHSQCTVLQVFNFVPGLIKNVLIGFCSSSNCHRHKPIFVLTKNSCFDMLYQGTHVCKNLIFVTKKEKNFMLKCWYETEMLTLYTEFQENN
jgi:hypothetical protein